MSAPERYEYDILTEKFDRSIGGLHPYLAKAILVRIKDNNQRERVLSHGPGAVWGNTEKDARERMQEAIEKWISRQRST